MPVVTALRADRGGRVRVEVDREPWRVVPVEAAARAGLAVGIELDGPRLRSLVRELRRARAVGVATRALARRDLSEQGLRERLRRAGVDRADEEAALGAFRGAGLVDDRRFAVIRAESLAERGFGDAGIRFELERQGVDAEVIAGALAELEPERNRADEIVARRGGGAATARYLARRGFDEEAVAAAASASVAPGT